MLGRWYGMVKADTRDTVDMIRRILGRWDFQDWGW